MTSPQQFNAEQEYKIIEKYKESVGSVSIGGSEYSLDDAQDFFIKEMNTRQDALLDEVIATIEQGKVPLRDKSDHLPNAYQYLKGKNEARDDVIDLLRAFKTTTK